MAGTPTTIPPDLLPIAREKADEWAKESLLSRRDFYRPGDPEYETPPDLDFAHLPGCGKAIYLRIPNWKPDGSRTKQSRYRWLYTPIAFKAGSGECPHGAKYRTLKAVEPSLYIPPPTVEKAKGEWFTVYLVEGEKKSLRMALDLADDPEAFVYGLSGCRMAYQTERGGNRKLRPEVRIACTGADEIRLAFDGDTSTNPDVLSAYERTVALIDSELGIPVRRIVYPEGHDKYDDARATGIDPDQFAWENALPAILARMLDGIALVGGKTLFNLATMDRMQKQDAFAFYENKRIDGENALNVWMRSAGRKEAKDFALYPDQDYGVLPDDEISGFGAELNLWNGFKIPAQPGDAHLPYLNLLEEVIAGEEEGDEQFNAFLDAWAQMRQKPSEPPKHIQIVYSNAKGSGKSSAHIILAKAVQGRGLPLMATVKGKEAQSGFTRYFSPENRVIVVEDAEAADLREFLKTVKTTVADAEGRAHLHLKGVDAREIRSYAFMVGSTNRPPNQWCSPDRRVAIYHVSEKSRIHDDKFKAVVADAMREDTDDKPNMVLRNLAHFLKTRDLSKYDRFAVVRGAKQDDYEGDGRHPLVVTLEELHKEKPVWFTHKVRDRLYEEGFGNVTPPQLGRAYAELGYFKRTRQKIEGKEYTVYGTPEASPDDWAGEIVAQRSRANTNGRF